jgi:LPXTG-motif cell wall-anchored protein
MTYVLRDQSESTPITVTAFDKAGNKSSIFLHPDTGKKKYLLWAGGSIALLLIGFVLLRRFKSMRKKNA